MCKRKLQPLGLAVFLLTVAGGSSAFAQGVTLFTEDFESLVLGPIETFDSEFRATEAWTDTPPAGWVVDDSGVPTVGNNDTGVEEFEGWSFVDRDWWIETAGNQRRNEFLSGSGVIAVADPDEWDDFGTPDPTTLGFFDARLTTPAIDLTAAPTGQDVKVFFNSSWRPEDDQKAVVTATFNDPQNTQYELLRYESVEKLEDESDNPFFQDDATNESIVIPFSDNSGSGGSDFSIPAGATEVSLEFRLLDAGNDWWWAFDNLQVFTGDTPPSIVALNVVIDRDTSNVKLVNTSTEPVDIRGYSVTSDAGVFKEGDASFLAPADNWLTATNTEDESNDLSEVNLTSDTIGPGEEIDFGNVWQKYTEDESDVSFEYLLAGNDTPVPGIVEFVGNNDESFEFLDLNYDSVIDIADWEEFKASFGKSLEGLTEAERYNLGDLNDDERHTPEDFLIFRDTFDSVNGAGAFAAAIAASSVPEPTSAVLLLGFLGLMTGRRMPGRRRAALVIGVCLSSTGTASAQLTLYFENFDGANAPITLGPFVEEDEIDQVGDVWTNTLPGWATDNSGVPGVGINDIPGISEEEGDDPTTDRDSDGVFDWSNWAWVDKQAWIEAASDQGRSDFTRASGNVMVADADEWDDADSDLRDPLAQDPTPDNLYDVFATTPTISIPAGIPAGRIRLSLDSSWRGNEFQDDLDEENNQTAIINARYNGGSPIEVFRRESDPDDETYDPEQENERITQLDLQYDGVATELQLEFGLTGAWNDWWWAVDNISVSVPSNPLVLEVDLGTGRAVLKGDDTISTAINFLQIESDNGVLTGESATGLTGAAGLSPADGPDAGDTAGDTAGEQWESLTDPETADSLIAEAFLFGESAFDDTVAIDLGTIFDTTTAEADRDIRFSYVLNTGDVIEVPIESIVYVGEPGLQGDFNGDSLVNAADYAVLRDRALGDSAYDAWAANFGASSAASGANGVSVPEPTTFCLLALATLVGLRLRSSPSVLALLFVLTAISHPSEAATLDRDYSFGDDSAEEAAAGAIVGSAAGNGATFDSAGDVGMNQLIDLLPAGPTPFARPRYVDVTDRPDMLPGSNVPASAGLGIALNPFPEGSAFNEQYLHTGFEEALNYPERSPSSTFSTGGTINYDVISDRGFQLWAKPTAIQESHIVMDSNQHGVLINADGEFAMRYAFDQETIDQRATTNGIDPSELADLFDYSSGVVAEVDTWYHLSVVRPEGPGNGSILYVNGLAVAAATGVYNVEEVPTDDQGEPNLTDLDTSPLVVGANTGNPSFGTDKFFRGVVDDLELFVMGINADRDPLTNAITEFNFYGEYVFEDDNEFAAAFKPTTDGDLDGDDDIDLNDAMTFADNWLFENRLEFETPSGEEDSLVVGDLNTRSRGDFNYDGIVDLEDWAILNNANPTMAAVALQVISGQAIPEPAGVLVAVLGVTGLLGRRRVAKQLLC